MTIGAMKNIDTVYRGYRFRSRLEARWAVFFDAMGVRWEYEHEGFQLAQGWYLPDFWLPEADTLFDVKPWDWQSEIADKIKLTLQLGELSVHHNTGIVMGTPGEDSYGVLFTERGSFELAEPSWLLGVSLRFLECRKCDGIWLGNPDVGATALVCSCTTEKVKQPYAGERLQRAYAKARSARFEHGESP